MCVNFVHATNSANHYAAPPACEFGWTVLAATLSHLSFPTLPASSGKRLCNGTVSVSASVCLSRRSTAAATCCNPGAGAAASGQRCVGSRGTRLDGDAFPLAPPSNSSFGRSSLIQCEKLRSVGRMSCHYVGVEITVCR